MSWTYAYRLGTVRRYRCQLKGIYTPAVGGSKPSAPTIKTAVQRFVVEMLGASHNPAQGVVALPTLSASRWRSGVCLDQALKTESRGTALEISGFRTSIVSKVCPPFPGDTSEIRTKLQPSRESRPQHSSSTPLTGESSRCPSGTDPGDPGDRPQ